MRAIEDPDLTAATKKFVSVHGVILLHVPLGDLHVNAWIGVVPCLAVTILLGTSFIEYVIRVIYPQERKAFPLHYHPFSIVDILDKSKYTTVYNV